MEQDEPMSEAFGISSDEQVEKGQNKHQHEEEMRQSFPPLAHQDEEDGWGEELRNESIKNMFQRMVCACVCACVYICVYVYISVYR